MNEAAKIILGGYNKLWCKLIYGGILSGVMGVSHVYALDYNHPNAPKNSSDCRVYASSVVEAVDYFIEDNLGYDDYKKLIKAMLAMYEKDSSQSDMGWLKYQVVRDADIWYRDQRIIRDREGMYLTLIMECEMAVIDNDYEQDMKELNEVFKGLE